MLTKISTLIFVYYGNLRIFKTINEVVTHITNLFLEVQFQGSTVML